MVEIDAETWVDIPQPEPSSFSPSLSRSLTHQNLLEYKKSVRFRKHVHIQYIPSRQEYIEESVEYEVENNVEIEAEQRHPHHHHHHRHHRHHHNSHPSVQPHDSNIVTNPQQNIGLWWCMSVDSHHSSDSQSTKPYMCIVS